MVQCREHVMQTVISKAGQHRKLWPLNVSSVDNGCYLVHSKVDFVPVDQDEKYCEI